MTSGYAGRRKVHEEYGPWRKTTTVQSAHNIKSTSGSLGSLHCGQRGYVVGARTILCGMTVQLPTRTCDGSSKQGGNQKIWVFAASQKQRKPHKNIHEHNYKDARIITKDTPASPLSPPPQQPNNINKYDDLYYTYQCNYNSSTQTLLSRNHQRPEE